MAMSLRMGMLHTRSLSFFFSSVFLLVPALVSSSDRPVLQQAIERLLKAENSAERSEAAKFLSYQPSKETVEVISSALEQQSMTHRDVNHEGIKEAYSILIKCVSGPIRVNLSGNMVYRVILRGLLKPDVAAICMQGLAQKPGDTTSEVMVGLSKDLTNPDLDEVGKDLILQVIGQFRPKDPQVLDSVEKVFSAADETEGVKHWAAKAIVSIRDPDESLDYFQKLGSLEQYLGMIAISDFFRNSAYSYGIVEETRREEFQGRFREFVLDQIDRQATNQIQEYISAVVVTFGGLFPLDRIVQDASGSYVLNPEFLKGVEKIEGSHGPSEMKQQVRQMVDRAVLELSNQDRLANRLHDQEDKKRILLEWVTAHPQ
jgi:hypothetical protein